MSVAINIQSDWSKANSVCLFRDDHKFCMKATGPEECVSVWFSVDSAAELRDYLTEQIEQAKSIKDPWGN